jgi:ATP-dependent DNA ligase
MKPCPTLSDKAPSGPQWIHEIKHDGFRIVACKSGDTVRLWSRNGRAVEATISQRSENWPAL